MLRAGLLFSRRSAIAAARCNGATTYSPSVRSLADNTKPSVNDPSPAVLPGSQSKTAPKTPPPPGAIPVPPSPPLSASETTIPPSKVPLQPPSASASKVQTAPPTSVPPPSSPNSSSPPPSPTPKRKPRRFTRFLLYLIALSGLSFVGGVWYSLRSDNFHDFFTEYIPFGEDAVLYFEEREFRKRSKVGGGSDRPKYGSPRVTIPSNSGITSRDRSSTEEGSDLATKGRHMSAIEDNKPTAQQQSKQSPAPPPPQKPKQSPPVQEQKPAKIPTAENKPKEVPAASSAPASSKAANASQSTVKLPEVDEPSVFLPIARIDPLTIKDANEPLVQDLVKMLNDIIAVANADNATGKFNSSIAKAKKEISAVGRKIMDVKAAQQKSADEKITATQAEFDRAARELLRRLEQEMRDQEAQWRDEFESERQKMANIYDDRFKSELQKSKQISEQQVRNQLLEQSIALKKEFESAVQDRVETERQGRLSKLSGLSSSIEDLEKLTKQWNSVLDANLQTQHLQVAVEAIRSGLENADRPRPFVRELAALKELAAENPVVDSAIASINPTAYQLGIPASAQLIDRFRLVAGEVRKASLLPEDAGIGSHAASFLLSKVMFKKQGRAVGDDVESVLTRTETLLEEGNLDEAAREMNTLNGWAKTLSRDWLGEVRKVLEVRQALDVISTEARLQSLKVD